MKYLFVLWTTLIGCLFAALFVLQSYFFSIAISQPFDLKLRVIFEGTQAFFWILLTPLVLYLSERWNLHTSVRVKSLIIHFMAGFLIGYIHRACSFWIYVVLYPIDPPLEPSVTWAKILGSVMNSVMIYWCIVAVAYAMHYVRAHQSEKIQAARLQNLFQQAQMASLRMQIQPHFLFNTLHSIAALMDDDTDGARRMLAKLSAFLRHTLDQTQRDMVSLEEEIGFIKNYLEIEAVRFQERLRVDFNIVPESLYARVPSLILQPLVENAVRHGVAKLSGPSSVTVSSEITDNMLIVKVTNACPPNTQRNSGIGLSNTKSRIQAAYGDAGSFDYQSENNLFTAILRLPYEKYSRN